MSSSSQEGYRLPSTSGKVGFFPLEEKKSNHLGCKYRITTSQLCKRQQITRLGQQRGVTHYNLSSSWHENPRCYFFFVLSTLWLDNWDNDAICRTTVRTRYLHLADETRRCDAHTGFNKSYFFFFFSPFLRKRSRFESWNVSFWPAQSFVYALPASVKYLCRVRETRIRKWQVFSPLCLDLYPLAKVLSLFFSLLRVETGKRERKDSKCHMACHPNLVVRNRRREGIGRRRRGKRVKREMFLFLADVRTKLPQKLPSRDKKKRETLGFSPPPFFSLCPLHNSGWNSFQQTLITK